MVISIRTIASQIKYKVLYQLQMTAGPQKLLLLDSANLYHLIVFGYSVDDNVASLKIKYQNVVSIPVKKKLTAEEKLTLKED